MTSQTFIDYFNERNSSLIRHLYKTDEKQIEKSIHKLRVEIKKIHFILSFAYQFNHSFPVKSFYSPYRKVFKTTGAIRELELLQELLKEYFPGSDLKKQIAHLHKKEKDLTQKFISETDEHSKKIRKTGKKVVATFTKFPVLSEEDYIYSLALFTGKQFSRITVEHLHESRKTLKAIIYSKQLFPRSLSFKRNLNGKSADDLQDLIGSWHDKTLLLEWVNENLKTDKYSVELKTLKNAINADYKRIALMSKTLLKS